jgi:hypothetical protein
MIYPSVEAKNRPDSPEEKKACAEQEIAGHKVYCDKYKKRKEHIKSMRWFCSAIAVDGSVETDRINVGSPFGVSGSSSISEDQGQPWQGGLSCQRGKKLS